MTITTILTWNVERQRPGSRKAGIMLSRIAVQAPELACLTEAHEGSLSALGGHEISTAGVAWSKSAESERKVVLWSRSPWHSLHTTEDEALATGAFLAASTQTSLGTLNVIGVCIPYAMASPLGVTPRRKPWSEHLRYLAGLQRVIAQRDPNTPLIVLGDFNQFVPRIWGSRAASEALITALDELRICTTGVIEGVGRPAIDHVALCPRLSADWVRGIDEHDEAGRSLSDHFGVVAGITKREQALDPRSASVPQSSRSPPDS